jgi:hypothetical protein
MKPIFGTGYLNLQNPVKHQHKYAPLVGSRISIHTSVAMYGNVENAGKRRNTMRA